MNGRPWSREEIDELCRLVGAGGSTIAFAIARQRTHEAVIAKARRLELSFPQSVCELANAE